MNVLPNQAPAAHAMPDPPRPAPQMTQEISRPVVPPNQPAAMNEQEARPGEHRALREEGSRTDHQQTASGARENPGSLHRSDDGGPSEVDPDRPQVKSGSLGSVVDVFA